MCSVAVDSPLLLPRPLFSSPLLSLSLALVSLLVETPPNASSDVHSKTLRLRR
jgi:hypothetical protein